MNSNASPIIGSIIERTSTSKARPPTSNPASGSKATGFPSVQHRSKSAFSRNREEVQRKNSSGSAIRNEAPPVVASQARSFKPSPLATSQPNTGDVDDMRDLVSKENEARIAGMTPEEIEEERQQIIERFGSGIGGVLERAKRNRTAKASRAEYVGTQHRHEAKLPASDMLDSPQVPFQEVPITLEEPRPVERARSPPPPALSAGVSRPSSRAERKLRFAELEPKDVYLYESHPPSPKRTVLALPPPSTEPDSSVVSLGTWHGKMAAEPQPTEPASVGLLEQPKNTAIKETEPEEGTPEYIRRRYFPQVPADDPGIEWMTSGEDKDTMQDSNVRFDLRGAPIPKELTATLPTHLGLHHHAEGSHAGYTLDDIFLLSRSTVPAQRSAMFGILAGITERLAKLVRGGNEPGLKDMEGKEENLRKRIAGAGVEAMNERGNVGLQAIDVVWRAVADWDREIVSIAMDGVALDSPGAETIRSLPLDFILPSIASIFDFQQEAYPPETLKQLLEVIQRLALQNSTTAKKIVDTDKLLSGIARYFIFTPLPPNDASPLPDPTAIALLTSLASASRQAAEQISRLFSDSLLRFITFLPSSSPYPPPLTTALITSTLNFYASLARYGLYAQIASTAMEQFARLGEYVISMKHNSCALVSAWFKLTQVWTTCAVDPHVTTPPHDILWSRVSAWSWHSDALQLAENLEVDTPEQWSVWDDILGTLAVWLEGCKVNGSRGGEHEREVFIHAFTTGVGQDGGKVQKLVDQVLDHLLRELEATPGAHASPKSHFKTIASYASTLTSVIRLWLACLPPHLEGPPTSPPFNLSYGRISTMALTILTHRVWDIYTPPSPNPREIEGRYCGVYLRDLSSLVVCYLRLSRRLPDVSQELWLAQAFCVLLRCIPGDEDVAQEIANQILENVPQTASMPGVIDPFIGDAVLPARKDEEPVDEQTPEIVTSHPRLAPRIPTPRSISYATRSTMPSPFVPLKATRALSGLPLSSDWMMSPLNHLINSQESPIFKHLPPRWDFSELDVTRVSLQLGLTSRELLQQRKLLQFAPGREQSILACMKVFMLEHGLVQERTGTSTDEVFRDTTVEGLMKRLLGPYRFREIQKQQSMSGNKDTLETFAASFLGPSTPFYQFYTDFIALYDAISFSHPLFGLLLLPPISMQYAIDYRRLFWCDYSHIIRTISVSPDQVLSPDLREYFYPVETDSQVLGGHLAALVKGNAKDFLKWVAIHHIASNIWGDLRREEAGVVSQERAGKLFQAVVLQGDSATISEIAKYYQPSQSEGLRLAPGCFDVDFTIMQTRKRWVQDVIGGTYAEKVRNLLYFP
ncbi:cytoplasmic protein [Coprinopsis marcescibilis]|uniref:Cytoplasmic protein n=1 Tax=Coprinopsis marcescibilis TaxID=230819 RepID=A0A5C3L4M1_COPMA|nr:cytoplasmic protein [Coprinopsis marcescibilis]